MFDYTQVEERECKFDDKYEEYWNNFYHENGEFTWCQGYDYWKKTIRNKIPDRDMTVLVTGCGVTNFGQKMIEDGYRHVINTDISEVVIEKCHEVFGESENCSYIQADGRDLPLEDESIDFVFGKGVLDAVCCVENHQSDVYDMLLEIQRVLKPGGLYMEVAIRWRGGYLSKPGLNWYLEEKQKKAPKFRSRGKFFYISMCTKIDPSEHPGREVLEEEEVSEEEKVDAEETVEEIGS